jgi:hypothetical protein
MLRALLRATTVVSAVAWALSAAPALAGFLPADGPLGSTGTAVSLSPMSAPATESSTAGMGQSHSTAPVHSAPAPRQPLIPPPRQPADTCLPASGSPGGMGGGGPTGSGGSVPPADLSESPGITLGVLVTDVQRESELRLPTPFLDGIFRPPKS